MADVPPQQGDWSLGIPAEPGPNAATDWKNMSPDQTGELLNRIQRALGKTSRQGLPGYMHNDVRME